MEDRIMSKINELRIEDLENEVEEIGQRERNNEEVLISFMEKIRSASTI
jgi:hypothetical protein